jgi:excisionase family DNA binding protein
MDKLFTVEEVSEKLQVHWQTVLNYIKSGELRAVRIGRGYRIDPEDLQSFIEARKTKN